MQFASTPVADVVNGTLRISGYVCSGAPCSHRVKVQLQAVNIYCRHCIVDTGSHISPHTKNYLRIQ